MHHGKFPFNDDIWRRRDAQEIKVTDTNRLRQLTSQAKQGWSPRLQYDSAHPHEGHVCIEMSINSTYFGKISPTDNSKYVVCKNRTRNTRKTHDSGLLNTRPSKELNKNGTSLQCAIPGQCRVTGRNALFFRNTLQVSQLQIEVPAFSLMETNHRWFSLPSNGRVENCSVIIFHSVGKARAPTSADISQLFPADSQPQSSISFLPTYSTRNEGWLLGLLGVIRVQAVMRNAGQAFAVKAVSWEFYHAKLCKKHTMGSVPMVNFKVPWSTMALRLMGFWDWVFRTSKVQSKSRTAFVVCF